ncbi:hypothetical protein [Paenibacillus turpanensis]|uniref:hypothetical protein n=1 Tax=Paenibacillus turpanensis TaxID=2689078 RepID=UPI001408405F|nr:hypothetical protein [Paenibacillus turpanensis]
MRPWLMLLVVICLALGGCSGLQPASTVNDPASFEREEDAKQVIQDTVSKAIAALRDQDEQALASLTHPKEGVLFSPYAYVEPKKQITFQSEDWAGAFTDQTRKAWGHYAGSGEPIELTFAEYYNKFVYDHPYSEAEHISYNRTMGKGTTTNNLFELYPPEQHITVEYHFPGFQKELEGMDWASLRLVFSEVEGSWYLTAICHDQWTI